MDVIEKGRRAALFLVRSMTSGPGRPSPLSR
jgi:hypothetical protein